MAQAKGDPVAMAAHLVALRKAVREAEQARAEKEFALEKRAAAGEDLDTHTIRVPAALMASWIETD